MVRQLIRDPDAFMERQIGKPTTRWELITLLVVGVLGAIGMAYIGTLIFEARPDNDNLNFPVIGLVLEPVIGIYILWIVYSVGIHLIANKVYNARGPIKRVFQASAWAMIPIGVANLVQTIAFYFVFQNIDIDQAISETTALEDPVDAVVQTGMEEPLYLIVPLVTILALAATWYLLVRAVEASKGLDRPDAVRTAGIIVGLHILYIVWQTLQVQGIL